MDIHVGHLRYGLYKRVQDLIHGGYRQQRGLLGRCWATHRMGAVRGRRARVLELACGGGSMVGAFHPDDYAGVDASAERIAAARRDHPHHRFDVVDVTGPAFDDVIAAADFVFCHGLLHHLDDAACRDLIARVGRVAARPSTFIAIEPLLPKPWRNPVGYAVGKLDEGHFFRESDGYRQLFGGLPLRTERFNLLPRLPLEMEAFVTRFP